MQNLSRKTFLVYDMPCSEENMPMQAIQIDSRVTSKKKSKQREQEAAIQAAQRAAEADAAASVTVKIYSVNETGASVSLECSQLDLAGQRPIALHGGALLGVAVGKHINSGVHLTTART